MCGFSTPLLPVQGVQDKRGHDKSMDRHLLLNTKAEPCSNFQVYSAELQNGLSGSSHTCTHMPKHQVHSHMHTGMHTHEGGTVDTRAHSCSQGLPHLDREAIVTFKPLKCTVACVCPPDRDQHGLCLHSHLSLVHRSLNLAPHTSAPLSSFRASWGALDPLAARETPGVG